MRPPRLFLLMAAGASILGLALVFAWIGNRFAGLEGWLSFLLVLGMAAGMLVAGWLLVQKHESRAGLNRLPGWLAAALLVAFFIRLGLGAVWFIILPVWGHPTPPEQSGYVMADAHRRDQAAWELAQSGRPLAEAFSYDPGIDQYGGLLFASSLVYRYLGGEQHHPLLVVVLGAAFSALSVVLVWAFARQAWNASAAAWGAWGLALYPEAALLGSSQMREAFAVTLVIAAFYGLLLFLRRQPWLGLIWIGAAFALLQLLSPPLGMFLFLLLSLVLLFQPASTTYLRSRRALWVWPVFTGLVILALVSFWYSARQFSPAHVTHPVQQVLYWINLASSEQKQIAESSSPIVGRLFASTPEWTHFPLLVTYGAVQPFLPAALLTGSASPVWQPVSIWRALGWALLLPLLLYAPLRAARGGVDRLALALGLGIWLLIGVAAFRAGGDQWDNPRYRAAFAALQLGLAGWAISEQRSRLDPWLRRLVWLLLGFLVPFIPWYLARQFALPWPFQSVLHTIALGLLLGLSAAAVDWFISARRGGRNPKSDVS
jgi:hypothetical protein